METVSRFLSNCTCYMRHRPVSLIITTFSIIALRYLYTHPPKRHINNKKSLTYVDLIVVCPRNRYIFNPK